jgi:G patch domain/KOW motif-containing protein
LKWVIPGIVIRVVSKKVAEGKLYNKKLKVTDVLSQYQFLAVLTEGADLNAYDNISEKDIETVMPKEINESLAVLRGEFKGEVGKLISRDRKKDEVVI